MNEDLEAQKKELEQEMLNYPPPLTNFKEPHTIVSDYLDVREKQSKKQLRLNSEFKNIYSQFFLAGDELEELSLVDEFIDIIIFKARAQAFREVFRIIGLPEAPDLDFYEMFMSESEYHCKKNDGLNAFKDSYIKYLSEELKAYHQAQ